MCFVDQMESELERLFITLFYEEPQPIADGKGIGPEISRRRDVRLFDTRSESETFHDLASRIFHHRSPLFRLSPLYPL